MLCVWWWCGGVIHWELVEKDQTITAETYCAQLDRVQAKLRSPGLSVLSRSGVSFLHDNARPHVAQQTQAKINELSWEQVTHTPYSPDLVPSDYHLFRSLEHATLRRKRYTNVIQVKSIYHSISLPSPRASTREVFIYCQKNGRKLLTLMVNTLNK